MTNCDAILSFPARYLTLVGLMILAAVASVSVRAGTADLGIRMTDVPGPVVVGNSVELRIVVTNRGPEPASGVTITYPLPDALDPHLRTGSLHDSQVITSLSDDVFSVRFMGTLDPGRSLYLSLSGRAHKLGSFTNVVSVSATTDDPSDTDNVAGTLTSVQEPYGTNIVRNGDAECEVIPVFTRDGIRWYGEQVGLGFTMVPGWWVTSNLTVQSYGAAPDFPSADSPGPGNRGSAFFTGEPCCFLSAVDQVCDLSAIATAVDSGGVPYQTSAYLGGSSDKTGMAWLRVRFWDGGSVPLGEVVLGPVTPLERTNATALLFRSAAGLLPLRTRAVQFTVATVRDQLVHGFVDNVSFVLSPSEAPTLEVGAAGPTEFRLFWPTNRVGFRLQRSSTLSPDSWMTLDTDPTVSGDRFTVVLPQTRSAEWFRLSRP